jgi:predicted solute-binding protein
VFPTLGPSPKANRFVAVTPLAVLVETERSLRASSGPVVVPAWMFNLAWKRLKTHGTMTNAELLEGLRGHRSSAVCAILGRLPGVAARAPPITHIWRGPAGEA